MDNIKALHEFAKKHNLVVVVLDSWRHEVMDSDQTVTFAWGTVDDLFMIDESLKEHRVTCEELLASKV